MGTECSRCHERYPSRYYFLEAPQPPVCIRCLKLDGLSREEQETLVDGAAAASGEAVRRCLRCQTPMMRGDLVYRDLGAHASTQVREVKWAVARRQAKFFGLVSEWVIDRSLAIDAWRCKGCGYCELSTNPDPSGGDPSTTGSPDHEPEDDEQDPSLL